MNTTTPTGGFDNLGIAPKLLEILAKHKFTRPTPIQTQSIPHAITGKDLMGIAQTGTGKTMAFGLPMIQRLAQSGGKSRGLVVLPTRELALQVNESLKKIGGSLGLKTAILIGGEQMGKQLRALKVRPHIIIATPGRLIDHIEQKTINLSNADILVLDEADRMLDMGFAPQLKKILENVPKERQTLLFSATMPEAIVKIANSYMKTPLRIEVAPAGSAVKSVTQEIFFLERNEKLPMLKNILSQYNGSVLVFSRTKHGAKKIARDIRGMKETATEIHSNRSLNQRIEALNGFKLGKYRVLVATDIAARGIDVSGIQLVVNFDLPDSPEDYVHRIGRTGRADMTGHAISFATHDQRRDVKLIERVIRKALPVSQKPASLPKVEPAPYEPDNDRGGRRPMRSSRPSTGKPNQSANRFNDRKFSHRSSGNRSYSNRSEGTSSGQRPNNRKRMTEYERGRKPAPQSLKKISPEARGFFISRKPIIDED
ncbi:MAG TPA: DEAD/DEAH box helicase [Candidatus Doudnabacteria bacterium]|nr:DEAD/DEAH box helicase [Candidatus Doudnabacteria bacterium]